jgi:hypothetical protein
VLALEKQMKEAEHLPANQEKRFGKVKGFDVDLEGACWW